MVLGSPVLWSLAPWVPSPWVDLAEAKLNWSSRVCDCVRKHAAARGVLLEHGPQGKFFKFDVLKSLLTPILDPSSALSIALDSDSIWHFHTRRICLYVFQTPSMCASESWAGDREQGSHQIFAAEAALGTGILNYTDEILNLYFEVYVHSGECCSQGRTMLFAQLRQTKNAAGRAELCYISLASLALSLQATSTHISSLHEYVATRKSLESLKN